MLTDRLTERAQAVISEFPKGNRVSVTRVLSSIQGASGMGNRLLLSGSRLSPISRKTVDIDKLVKEAYYQALKFEHPYVGTEHILLALLHLTKSTDETRFKLELLKQGVFPGNLGDSESTSSSLPLGLGGFSSNLSQQALRNLDKTLVERKEYESLVAALLLKEASNIILVGDKGVGKESLMEILARKIVSLEVPTTLIGTQIVEVDLLTLISTLLGKGNFELGLSSFIDDLKGMGKVILSLKNFQSMFFASTTGLTAPMFFSIFQSRLSSVGIPLIVTSTSSMYEKIVVENDHLFGDFTVIEIAEPTATATIEILKATAANLGQFHNVTIPNEVVEHVYNLADGWKHDVKFPQKGIYLLDHSCSYLLQKRSRIPSSYRKLVDMSLDYLTSLDSYVEGGEYDKALSMRKKLDKVERDMYIQEEEIFKPRTLKLTTAIVDEAFDHMKYDSDFVGPQVDVAHMVELADDIKKSIIGQDRAVDTVVKSLIRARLGLRSSKRPLGNFLFLGPTGVGKTELAKVLADEFFGEKSLIRLDMSDFSEKHNVARLVGAPPGYVGYGEGGELTSKIESNPDSLVLFDEIEKAHPDVLNILLQITEEGELTDARGSTFDFSRAVIILTSNLGTGILHKDGIGFNNDIIPDEKAEGRLLHNLKKILKPELLNRFDEVIVFRTLSRETQLRVINILIEDISRSLKLQNIGLSVSTRIKKFLLEKGYSREYGARALRRTIEKELLDKIAEFLLKNTKRPLKLKAKLINGEIIIDAKK